jgi:hypothetical protein
MDAKRNMAKEPQPREGETRQMEGLGLESVIEHARGHDAEALGEIYRRYVRRVFGLCRYMLYSRESAEDATSEVFLKLQRSIASYETFYSRSGQTWERMMLIKARHVAGDSTLGAEFIEMVQPFRFPRTLGEQIAREVAETKLRIEKEVIKEGDIERNVKLGRGGIREIEFVAQTLQLLHAGKTPFLQGGQTLPTLENLVRYQLLKSEEALVLREAYCFLRDVEHRLHDIPFDAHRGEVHYLPKLAQVREMPAHTMLLTLLAVEATGTRELGHYMFNHQPWPGH